MKAFKPFVVVCLLASLILTGCDDGGFSISPSGDYDVVEEDKAPDPVEKPQGDGVHGGGDGANSEDNPQEAQQPIDDVTPGIPQEPAPQIDLGNQIVNFRLYFLSINDDDFAFVSYDEDPFEEKYNFAYYTIDNQELDNSKTVTKETVETKEVYKLYLGSKESKTYTIQFYNESGKQYGRADLAVSIPTVRHSFFNNIINIVEIKIVSVGMSFINQFNKVKEFFRKLFGGNGMTF